ncbi:uncharacterized protein THITE_113395 [Thermothielavioides terrestris NRRL 8126]|jgi:hypothetical protein|uniref:Mid2 domain-containing protein n=1 Tax=Thermothielavioides terrestris (strain ATCC 38088 / NRRL 8126) TaxID=578455 RepID=G2R946_THETT|nr:uncharacterized protein THITE_113395 [Thermothielavioides terrestris NRRL 8126]AEO68641.1 hypothetical protein THITE_113395 [Thermothielavioides terrestris NRRL 8126]
MATWLSAAELQPRQTRVVTQTITRPFTTITAVVTLGDGPTTSTSLLPTATSTPGPPSTPDPATALSADADALTPSQLGAILGAVLGVAFVVLLVCCILSLQRRRRQALREQEMYYYYGGGGEEEESEYSESEVVRQERVRRTPAWNRRHPQPQPVYSSWDHGAPGAAGFGGAGSTWTTVPPPVRFPPTPRYTPYRQTRERQIHGVQRYP